MTRKGTDEITLREHTLPSAHITRDLFCDWQEGKLKEPEETDLFSHIGVCTFCAEQFGNWMEEGLLEDSPSGLEVVPGGVPGLESAEAPQPAKAFLEEPPKYLKEEILSRIHQIDVQASVRLKETSRQVQLMVYSLKVGFAVIASIFLLAVTTSIRDMDLELPRTQQTEQMQEEQESREEEEGVVDKLRRGSKEITGLLNEISSGLFRIGLDDSEKERNQEVTR